MAGPPSEGDGPFLEPFPNVLLEELFSPSGSILDPLGRVFGPSFGRFWTLWDAFLDPQELLGPSG